MLIDATISLRQTGHFLRLKLHSLQAAKCEQGIKRIDLSFTRQTTQRRSALRRSFSSMTSSVVLLVVIVLGGGGEGFSVAAESGGDEGTATSVLV